MIDDAAQGFYPSDSWAVAIDGFLEQGGAVQVLGEVDIPWESTEGAMRSDTLVFGSRRVAVAYISRQDRAMGPPYTPGQVMLWPHIHWLGGERGERDFSDTIWKWMGEVVRGDVPGPGEMDLTWKEQIVDGAGWREYRNNWSWVHGKGVGLVCSRCGCEVLQGETHLSRGTSSRCALLVNLTGDP